MTPKERIWAHITGGEADRPAWSPNLAYWWDYEDPALTSLGEVEVLEKMGCDPLIRGHQPKPDPGQPQNHIRMYATHYGRCRVESVVEGSIKRTVMQTPKGDMTAAYTASPGGKTWFLTRHPVQGIDDYEKLACLFDEMTLEPDYTEYERTVDRYGERMLLLPMLSPELNLKTGFQAMLEFWCGTEHLVYDVCDYPDVIEAALKSMRRVSRLAAELSAASPAEAFITWEDTSTTNISPGYYRSYVLPEIEEWCAILHADGKRYIQHACGHLKDIIADMGASSIDGIESISPPPTGNLELADARKHMKPSQCLIGGIEPTIFLNAGINELADYARRLLDEMRGTPFILANSDSCPPFVAFEKFERISRLVREYAL